MDGIKQAIARYIKIYDEKINFPEYARQMLVGRREEIPDDDRDFKICCPLHDENTPSFLYSNILGIWKCFGECGTGGKVFRFHKLYMEKQYGKGKVTAVMVLRDLYRNFPQLVPEPKFQRTTARDTKTNISRMYNQILKSSDKEIVFKNNHLDINQFILEEFINVERG